MTGGPGTRFDVPRDDLVGALIERARGAEPVLLTGPPGAGKTTLLHRTADRLARAGMCPVYLDLLCAASTPERFVSTVLRAWPGEDLAARAEAAGAIRRLAEGGRLRGAEAVQALCAWLASAETAGGRPIVLLLDELTEIRSLAYFPGLRRADQMLAEALCARRGATLLATSFPTLARRLWRFAELAVGPLGHEELAPVLERAAAHLDPAALARATCGWARYVRVLLEQTAPDGELEAAWVAALSPGGRLDGICRATYETLLLRSRGYGASKAALAAVAREEGLNLTALVARLGRTPGATRDYLHWLVGVDALHAERKRYHFVDGLLGLWVRLYADGTGPDAATLHARYAALAERSEAGPARPAATPARTEPQPAAPRRDTLIEID